METQRTETKHPCEICDRREFCAVEENALAPGLIVVTCAALAALLVICLMVWRWLAC